MANLRASIRMSDGEVAAFLEGRHTLRVATLDSAGRPHLVAMWYGFLAGDVAFWTYRRSQKVVNLRRDPRITCLVDEGVSYDRLRGVELVGRGEIVEDRAAVAAVGESVWSRHVGPIDDDARRRLAVQGAKRVAVRVVVERSVSWDHTKLPPP